MVISQKNRSPRAYLRNSQKHTQNAAEICLLEPSAECLAKLAVFWHAGFYTTVFGLIYNFVKTGLCQYSAELRKTVRDLKMSSI